MDTLTPQQITDLLAKGGYRRRSGANPKNHYYIRTPDGLQRITGKPPADLVGKFEGNKGTVHRSRKGRTSIKANGSRRYIMDTSSQIVAYKVSQ